MRFTYYIPKLIAPTELARLDVVQVIICSAAARSRIATSVPFSNICPTLMLKRTLGRPTNSPGQTCGA
jgi:hypothetical protein